MKRLLLAGAGLALVTWASVAAHDWWVGAQAVARDRISRLERDIAAGKERIRLRDRQLDSLKQRDLQHQAQIREQAARADRSAEGWTAAQQEIRALAALNGGLIPLARFEEAARSANLALLDCQDLNADLAARNQNLEAQIANQAGTRTELETIGEKKDTLLVETVKSIRPPWWKRSFSWVQDHAVTSVVAGGVGFMLAKR